MQNEGKQKKNKGEVNGEKNVRKKFLHLMLPSTKLILIVFHFTFAAAEDAVDAASAASLLLPPTQLGPEPFWAKTKRPSELSSCRC